VLNRVVLREQSFADAMAAGGVTVQGDAANVADLFTLFDDFTLMFEVVEPRRIEHRVARGKPAPGP
jgi:alkyl sulfatase BDS1-like metallo-beta-lactamase superfamily hydrolase